MGELVAFTPPEMTQEQDAYQRIQNAITATRDGFIADYQAGKYGSTFQTYEDELDRAVYKTLGGFCTEDPHAFQRAKGELDSYTRFQLETSIGERLNVGLSKYAFRLEDGQIASEKTGDSIIGMIDRGRKTRNAQVEQQIAQGKVSLEVGQQIIQRHDAEVEQFRKIQEVMGDANTLPGTTMISVSPPGPGYVHNFYDVFILKEEGEKRFIEARRYASALTPEEALTQAQAIQAGYGDDKGDMSLSSYFLANPITLKDPLHILFNQPDKIHSFMHADHESMTAEDFDLIKEVCAGIISVYLQEVFEHPDDADKHAEILDALKNKADEAAGNIKVLQKQAIMQPLRRGNSGLLNTQQDSSSLAYAAAMADIGRLGSQPVRTVKTGCGESGSSRKKQGGVGSFSAAILGEGILPGNMSPMSLLDDILNEEQEWFTCPKCSYKADGPVGDTCPGCGLTKEDWAKESGKNCA